MQRPWGGRKGGCSASAQVQELEGRSGPDGGGSAQQGWRLGIDLKKNGEACLLLARPL